MAEAGAILLVRLIMLMVLLSSCVVIVLAVAAALKGPSWVSVLFQLSERPSEVRGPLIRSAFFAAAVGLLAFGAPGLAAAMLAWVVLAPRYIGWRARARAWAGDQPSTRREALLVRNRLRELRQEEALIGDVAWPEYIIDAAKAERQRQYQQRFDRADGQEAQPIPVAQT